MGLKIKVLGQRSRSYIESVFCKVATTQLDLNSLTFPDSRQKNIEIPGLSRRSNFSLIFPDGGNPGFGLMSDKEVKFTKLKGQGS